MPKFSTNHQPAPVSESEPKENRSNQPQETTQLKKDQIRLEVIKEDIERIRRTSIADDDEFNKAIAAELEHANKIRDEERKRREQAKLEIMSSLAFSLVENNEQEKYDDDLLLSKEIADMLKNGATTFRAPKDQIMTIEDRKDNISRRFSPTTPERQEKHKDQPAVSGTERPESEPRENRSNQHQKTTQSIPIKKKPVILKEPQTLGQKTNQHQKTTKEGTSSPKTITTEPKKNPKTVKTKAKVTKTPKPFIPRVALLKKK